MSPSLTAFVVAPLVAWLLFLLGLLLLWPLVGDPQAGSLAAVLAIAPYAALVTAALALFLAVPWYLIAQQRGGLQRNGVLAAGGLLAVLYPGMLTLLNLAEATPLLWAMCVLSLLSGVAGAAVFCRVAGVPLGATAH